MKQPTSRLAALALAGATLVATLALAPPASAVTTTITTVQRVNLAINGLETTGYVGRLAEISDDGQFATFSTGAALLPEDTNGVVDVYRLNRFSGSIERVSLDASGNQIAGDSYLCGVSRNGRYIGFAYQVTGQANPGMQVYLRRVVEKQTVPVSQSTAGLWGGPGTIEVETDSALCPISDNGRYVAFTSSSGTLVSGDSNAANDAFRRDTVANNTILVSRSTGGTIGDLSSRVAALSADGTKVLFDSASTNLVASDTNALKDVFLRDITAATTTRISTTTANAQLTSASNADSLSGDGNVVAFSTAASTLVASDTNSAIDVFVRNRTANTMTRASVSSAEVQAIGSSADANLSTDGNHVLFVSGAKNLVAGKTTDTSDLFVRHLGPGTTEIVSRTWTGGEANALLWRGQISSDGTVVAFRTGASNMVSGDSNAKEDVFVRDTTVEITPFATVAGLIKQQYQDFAGRAPTAGELSSWTTRIGNGEVVPDRVATSLARIAPWNTKRAPLVRLYWAFFLRPPDTGGMNYWLGKLNGGMKLAEVAKKFADSSEFKNTYGSLSNKDFVTLIYQNIFERDPDTGGLNYWTAKLDSKQKTRGDVMTNFSESSEGKRFLTPQVDTVLVYLGMLRTMPSKATLAGWVTNLRAGGAVEQVSMSIRKGATYAGRITP
jgi:hypothetical protein